MIIFSPAELYPMGKSEKKISIPKNNRGNTTPLPPTEEFIIPVDEPEPDNTWTVIAGTNEGLFSVDRAGQAAELWNGGSVKKIIYIPAGSANPPNPVLQDTWVMLGSEGILVSGDLAEWEKRNQGLPVKIIKIFDKGEKRFLPMVQEIKDIEINPADPEIMVCATKDMVYLSRDQGLSWKSLGSPPYRTNGIKAVAAAWMPAAFMPAASTPAAGAPELTIFLSHSTYGIFYIQPDRPGSQWTEMNKGLETLETTGNADEVSDIAVRLSSGEDGTVIPAIFVSQTFRRRIYQLDWNNKTFSLIWSDKGPFGTVDSLAISETGLNFLYEGTVASLEFSGSPAGDPVFRKRQDILDSIKNTGLQSRLNCVVMRNDLQSFSELWLLDEQEPDTSAERNKPVPNKNKPYSAQAAGREGIYLPVNHAMESRSLKPYLDVIERGGLDMIVIDMKDDYGRLRFTPLNSAISAKGRVFRPLDIDAFLGNMKERGIYTAARVVVFKDPELAARENGRFAVWDSRNSKPWVGYYDTRQKKSEISEEDRRNNLMQFFPSDNPDYEIVRTFYDEHWVDPFSEEVWEYIAVLSEELHERGFDEIQFDYIRFPTDGENLANARYRWQDNGMDMESAILSFLRHIRSKVKAPISIDIYGANGWYRTGARTGQEVELLAPWVDVICPMYYPSHFEQHFLAQNPPELRPWRIYYHGTLRTARIGRGQAIIRPYVQAFFLNVSYDRKYYNADYVMRQVEGVRAAGNGGLTYWNNSGRYDEVLDKE